MGRLVVASPASGEGKTVVSVGLLQWLRRHGQEVGYRRGPGAGAEADTAFVARALGDSVVETPGQHLILEVSSAEDARSAVADGAIPLVVVAYRGEGLAEKSREFLAALGHPRPLVVLNQVPIKGERAVRMKVIPALADVATVLGVIPEDRVLRGMTVGDLARSLQAVILSARDELERPVEAVMIAAMSDEGAEEYFRRVARKAVVAGGDRPDIHLPALATDTSCLVLTEGLDPDPTVLDLAEDLGVPLLKVQPDTLATLDQISDALASARFAQRYKLSRVSELIDADLDHDALLRALAPDAASPASGGDPSREGIQVPPHPDPFSRRGGTGATFSDEAR